MVMMLTYCAEAYILLKKKQRSKETGLEVNADKTKYMVMSQDQNGVQSQNKKLDDISLERVEEFKYLGTTPTNQNSIQ